MENKENVNRVIITTHSNAAKKPTKEETQIRDLQNRIRNLEVDNELMKSQIINNNTETRHAFLEIVERIEYLESKITLMNIDEKGAGQQILFKTETGSVPIPNQTPPLDALTCVETVMDASCYASPGELTIHLENDDLETETAKTGTSSTLTTESEETNSTTQVLPLTLKPSFSEDLRKRYDCNLCGKCFSQSSGLSRHLKIHLKQQQVGKAGPDTDKSTKPKRFFCTAPNCKSAFTSRSGMTKHAKNYHHDPSIKPLIVPAKGDDQPTSSVITTEEDIRAVVNQIIESTMSVEKVVPEAGAMSLAETSMESQEELQGLPDN